MAVVTESIGTAQDFSTVTLWEADLANKNAADDIIGEMINQTYDEAPTFNDSTPNSVKLSVESTNRHDGTAGTGARQVNTTQRQWLISTPNGYFYKIEWIEFDVNDEEGPCIFGNAASPGDVSSIQNCLMHNQLGGDSSNGFVQANTRDLRVQNCICYVNSRGATGIVYGLYLDSDRTAGGCFNNTVWGVENTLTGNAAGIGIRTNSVNSTVKNNISGGHASTSGTPLAFEFVGTSPDSDNNLSDDATADDGGGASNVINATTIDFISTVGGSEDFHLNSESSEAHGAGVDLGTTPNDVEIDIDDTNRDTDIGADAWDIGAHQLIVAAGGGQAWPSHTKQLAHLLNR